jgi:signal transduction histidine kinase/HPt (histidine-containing phosphotransfer) domain-containing protein/ActR/RegA family two-component response regulator
MRWIQNLDLKNKLVLLSAVSGAMAVFMACAGFVWHDVRLLRSAQIQQLRTQAEMLAFNCSGLAPHDLAAGFETLLAKLETQASIDSICLFDATNEVVAFYPITTLSADSLRLPVAHYSHRYTEFGELELFHPVTKQGEEIGVIYLKSNMREFYEQLYSYATVVVTVTSCSLAVALLFASMMQSLISQPILQLADAARDITTKNDYTIRVTSDSNDELGVLFGSFNRMVDKIQSSQTELKQAHDEMEHRVEQRTRQLQNEIVERERIQSELVRAKEAAEAASESKSRFLANMSHEIRTPLNGILGFADYILMHDHELREADRRDYLRTIKKSGESLLVLINDILDLSKIEAGQMDFEKVRFSPHHVIAEVISILRPKAREKSLNLDYQWNSVVPDTIESDPVRFRQLLMNLVGNAVKFSETGRVEVIAQLDQTTWKLMIDVIDTGIGIPLETQEALFKPFTQGDSSVTRRFGGTGLGLSICKNIARGLGGEVSVTSEIGIGSTFSFTIDTGSLTGVAMSPHPIGDIVSDEPLVSHVKSLASRQILVVEDGDTNRKLIRLVLMRAGADVVMVENGLDALAAAHDGTFDLILMDMQMPIMDGYSATKRLRAEGFTMPIVALTAHAMRGDEDRCFEAGCTEYLTKPIRQDLLLSTMLTLINRDPTGPGKDSRPDDDSEPVVEQSMGMLVSELPIHDLPFAELVCEFVERAREKMAELRQAHRTNDNDLLAKLAHWMKGSGGMAGFPQLTESSRALENRIRSSDIPGIAVGLDDLEALIDRLQMPELQPA